MKKRPDGKPLWQKTPVANLLKNRDSGRYYFRASVTRNGKRREVWRSLRTTTFSVAKLRLIDEQAKIEQQRQSEGALDGKTISMGRIASVYRAQVGNNAELKPKSKEAREEALDRLFRTWPGLNALLVKDITPDDCERWANAFKADAAGLGQPKVNREPSATTVNTTIDCIRRLFEIALTNGLIYRNPAAGLTKKRPPRKHLRLPSGNQFREMLALIAKNPNAPGAVNTVGLLGFSGLRLGEAMALKWRDVDFDVGLVHVAGTKTDSSLRTVPMFPPLREHLEQIRAGRKVRQTESVVTVKDCQKSMDAATTALGIERMTHHDLRHFFISSCIEAGIDFLTIARWVGHADGGVLISRVYGHLRREYSMEAAKRVTFE